jgi:ATP-binding cassette subfamily B (MDR/TAP) protein 1
VAIARALVRKPSVLILDEATSALDVESANLVRDTIKALLDEPSREMTVIIITHSREQMQIAERIVVLDQGQVAEEGTFDELLAANGALTNLLSGGEWDGGAEMRNERRAARVRGGLRMRDVEWRGRRARNRMRL